MATDPLWKMDGGFKNNYMNEIRRILLQKLPNFTKEVKQIDSRIKFLKNKFHMITEMCKQSGCTWNDVEKKSCVKSHGMMNGLRVTKMLRAYLIYHFLIYRIWKWCMARIKQQVLGPNILQMQLKTWKISMLICLQQLTVTVRRMKLKLILLCIKCHPLLRVHVVPTRKKIVSNKVSNVSKTNKAANVENVESDIQEFNAEVRCIFKNINSHFESMSTWMQGGSGKMQQVFQELGKYGFTGRDKYKAAEVICQDNVKVELLSSLDPTEVREYVLTFL